jgi:hypothetical protein
MEGKFGFAIGRERYWPEKFHNLLVVFAVNIRFLGVGGIAACMYDSI